MSEEKPKSKTLHIKTLDGGNRQAHELHRELAFKGATCSTCGDPAALRAKFLMEDSELRRRDPALYMALLTRAGGDPAFETKYGKMVLFHDMYGCDHCKSGLRKYAAAQPDYVLVEWDEGGLETTYARVIGAK